MEPGALLCWLSLRRVYVWAAVAVLIGSRFTTRRLALATKRAMTQLYQPLYLHSIVG
jgi:hypothetical protein